MTDFIIAWPTGHTPPKTAYYREDAEGHWGSTYEREKARRFRSASAALGHWLSLHAFPEEYERCITAGSVRSERYEQPELF